MKRTGFKRKAPVQDSKDPDRVRSTPTATPGAWRAPKMVVAAPVAVPKEAEAARPGKRAPTKAEREWMDAIVEHGCICCVLDGHAPIQKRQVRKALIPRRRALSACGNALRS